MPPVGHELDSQSSKDEPLVYAPLVAYSQPQVHPSKFVSNSRESSLHKFVCHVSLHHHLSAAVSFRSKNTSARPEKDPRDRIDKHSLNLSVRKWGRPPVCSKPDRSNLQARNRKLALRATRVVDSTVSERQLIFLRQMNRCWNKYVWGLLEINLKRDSSGFDLSHSLKSLSSSLEWIGAKIRIENCPALKDWHGKTGYLVGSSDTAWHIVTGVEPSSTRRQQLRVLHAPKLRSTVVILLPKRPGDLASNEFYEIDLYLGRRI